MASVTYKREIGMRHASTPRTRGSGMPRAMDERTDPTATPFSRADVPGPHTDGTRIRRHADRAGSRARRGIPHGRADRARRLRRRRAEPRVIPFPVSLRGRHIYIHGSPGNATLGCCATGARWPWPYPNSWISSPRRAPPDTRPTTAASSLRAPGAKIDDIAEKRRILDADDRPLLSRPSRHHRL